MSMNNISMHMGFSCGDDFEGKESEAPLLDETRDHNQHSSSTSNGMDIVHNHMVEVDFEFWPVEHPLEPPDEDRPVKCPMPDSSVINDGGRQEKRFSDKSNSNYSMRKRSEVSSAATYRNQGMDQMVVALPEPPPPVRPVRKRHHHTLTRGDHMISPLRRMPPVPSLPTQSITIFQMLQQLDKFES